MSTKVAIVIDVVYIFEQHAVYLHFRHFLAQQALAALHSARLKVGLALLPFSMVIKLGSCV